MIKVIVKYLASLLVGCSFFGYADEIFLCQDTSNHQYQLSWNRPDKIANCETGNTISHAADTKWLSIVPKDQSNQSFIVIDGTNEGKTFLPIRASLRDKNERDYFIDYQNQIPAMPNNLLKAPMLAFGVEERARITTLSNGSVQLSCDTGNKPAGVLFDLTQLSLSAKQNYFLQITGQLNRPISFAFSEKGKDFAANKAITLKPQLSSAQHLNLFNQHIKINQQELTAFKQPQLIFLCPNQQVDFEIKSMSIMPKVTDSKKVTSSWVWSTKQWQDSPESLISWAQKKGVNRLYLQLLIEDNQLQYQPQLKKVLSLANKANIAIFAVEGEPSMVTPQGLTNALARNRIIKQFCVTAKIKDCFAGIQYDIEPYILSEYSYQPDKIWQQWSQAIQALSESWGSPIEIAVPFWLINIKNGQDVVKSVSPYVSAFTIMAYRTTDSLVYDISKPWLIWADNNKQKVLVALENGYLTDETQMVFVPSQSGEIEKIPFNHVDAILWNKDKISGEGIFYTYRNNATINGNFISFMGQESKMRQTMHSLATIFAQWSSFEGFALHELSKE